MPQAITNSFPDKFKNFFKRYWPQFAIFFGVLIFHTLMLYNVQGLVMYTGNDEFCTIASGAFVSGLDWAPLVTMENNYYGFGFSILYAPWLWLMNDMVLAYHIMLMYNGALLGAGCVLCYNLTHNYYGVPVPTSILISLACGLCCSVTMSANSLFNEMILVFLVWVIVYILTVAYKNVANRKRITVLTIVLSLVLFYSLLIHTRAIFFIGGVMIAVFGCWLYDKKLIVNLPLFLVLCVVGFFVANQIAANTQAAIWSSDTTVSENDAVITNSVEDAGSIFPQIKSMLTNPSAQRASALALSLFAKFFISFTTSASLVALACVLCVYLLVRKTSAHTIPQTRNGSSQITDVEAQSLQLELLRLTVFFVFSALIATIAMTSLRTLPLVEASLAKGEASKFIAYLRYHAVYTGPLLMILFVYFYYQFAKANKVLLYGMTLSIFTIVIFMFISPYIYEGTSMGLSQEFAQFYPFTLLLKDSIMTGSTVFIHCIVAIILSLLLWIFLYRKKIKWTVFLSLLISVYFFGYLAFAIHIPASRSGYEQVDQTVSAMENLTNKSDRETLPSRIYIYNANRAQPGNNDYGNNLQFMMPRTTLYPIDHLPDEEYRNLLTAEDYLILSNVPLASFDSLVSRDPGYYMSILSYGEYLYVKGEAWKALLEEEGVSFSRVSYASPTTQYLMPRTFENIEQALPLSMFSTNVGTGERGSNGLLVQDIVSDGQEGALMYGPYITIPAGTSTWTVELELLSFEQSVLGSFYLSSFNPETGESVLLETKDLRKSDFRKANKATLTLSYTFDEEIPNFECCVFVKEGVYMRVNSVLYSHTNDTPIKTSTTSQAGNP